MVRWMVCCALMTFVLAGCGGDESSGECSALGCSSQGCSAEPSLAGVDACVAAGHTWGALTEWGCDQAGHQWGTLTSESACVAAGNQWLEGGAPPPTNTHDTTGGTGDTVAGDGTSGLDGTTSPDSGWTSTVPAQWQVPAETNAWGVLFEFESRIQTVTENELWLGDGSLGMSGDFEMVGNGAPGIKSVTDLGGLKNLDDPLSCDLGCVVSPDMKYIAVVVGQDTQGGFSMKLGNFNEQLEVKIVKGDTWDNIVDFQFAEDKLFFTRKSDQSCEHSCQYDFFRVQLPFINDEVHILTYPTAGELEQSTYVGHFKSSPDGSKLVMLNTTIRSVTVNMWQEGLGLFELDYICHFGTKGNCTGTGSEYHDQDPVGISGDGRWVAFFTYSERWQRIRLYDTQNPDVAYLTIAANVPDGNYISKACDPGNLEPWQWERVPNKSNPVFTPDGEEIVFQTETTCPLEIGGAKPKKPRTNLRRVKVEKLLQGTSLTEDDVFNVTDNPFDDVTANRRITSFDISPDGATVLFTATPTYDQNGELLGDGSARQRNDRELYRVRLDGTNLIQLTEDLSYMAHSASISPQWICCDLGEIAYPLLEGTCAEKNGTHVDASECPFGFW